MGVWPARASPVVCFGVEDIGRIVSGRPRGPPCGRRRAAMVSRDDALRNIRCCAPFLPCAQMNQPAAQCAHEARPVGGQQPYKEQRHVEPRLQAD
ncbi:Uncharacterised protein [Bordetella pertussis]|nr:Uncharacterised protein [Bordetella pertussis]